MVIKQKPTAPDYHGAILYSLGFGLLAALLWFAVVVVTGWQFGIVAIGVGAACGYGVYLGSKKHTGMNLQLMAAGFSLIAILVGEYLITNHFTYQYITHELGEQTMYFLHFWPIVQETFYFVVAEPLTLLFWAIAIYTGFAIPRDKDTE
ncbi:TPA: hypothetical protein HA278_03425 [Candidatus Woesearchaeota archaeon]|nr:hypothetical protein [archaeon]HIJ11083.1 hypothetical protein [Candidatus Woesearchaeota archaeon]|tara:strand:+ start:198 stop:644 length:447 start_codon:yes stop_codon:yes gene_type:complete